MFVRIQAMIAAILAALIVIAAPGHAFETRVIVDAYAEFDTLFARAEGHALDRAYAEFDAIYAAIELPTYEVYFQVVEPELSEDPTIVEFKGEFKTYAEAENFATSYNAANALWFCSRFNNGENVGMVIMDSTGEFHNEFIWGY